MTTQPVPVQIGTDADWSFVSAGYDHTCGIRGAGALLCWGSNAYGQLGDGGMTVGSASPIAIAAAESWSSVSAGDATTCAVRADGTLHCWGAHSEVTGTTGVKAPRQIGTDTGWASASVWSYHACALKGDGTIWCWGNGSFGACGPIGIYALPVRVGTNTGWTSVSVGQWLSCGTRADGKAYCWGSDQTGQLGDGAAWRLTPSLLLP